MSGNRWDGNPNRTPSANATEVGGDAFVGVASWWWWLAAAVCGRARSKLGVSSAAAAGAREPVE